jgi:hypothetical protein
MPPAVTTNHASREADAEPARLTSRRNWDAEMGGDPPPAVPAQMTEEYFPDILKALRDHRDGALRVGLHLIASDFISCAQVAICWALLIHPSA